MKVLFNASIKSISGFPAVNKPINNHCETLTNPCETTVEQAYTPAVYAVHPSFMAKCPANVLFTQTKNINCALTGKKMIPQNEIESIYEKLAKKTSVSSVIFFLQIYRDYMHDVERNIFDMFKNYKNYGNKNFQDVLKENYPDALKRLKEKELKILNSTDDIISDLSEDLSKQVAEIRDFAISKTSQETLCRNDVLTRIRNLKAGKGDWGKLFKIYKEWYNLPNSYKDSDAFIVEYANYPHDEIAHRLISTSVATLKAIKPLSEGGERTLGNYLLVSKLAAKESGSMPLAEYLALNPEAKENIQKYIDTILTVKEDNRPLNIARIKYPQAIQRSLTEETHGKFSPIVGESKSSKTNRIMLNLLSKHLTCAISGKPMLSPSQATSIYEKLSKRPNAKSAIKYLKNYEEYMQDTELQIFKMLQDCKHAEDKDFHDILQEKYPEAHMRLKGKQIGILSGKDDVIASLSGDLSHRVAEMRDFAIFKVNNGTFNCKNLLKQLQSLNVPETDKKKIAEIYKYWYTLPRANRDYDAFIVRYAGQPHEKIAQRLLSSSVAVVKPVKQLPETEEANIGNSILVAKRFDDFDSLSLKDYIDLNPSLNIVSNFQKYLDVFVNEINKGTNGFVNRKWYPRVIKKAVWEASNKTFMPEIKVITPAKTGNRAKIEAGISGKRNIKNVRAVKMNSGFAVHSRRN